jgi:hypothetical protein
MQTRSLFTQPDFRRGLNASPTHMSGADQSNFVGISILLLGSRNPFRITRFSSSVKCSEGTMRYLFVTRSFARGGQTFASSPGHQMRSYMRYGFRVRPLMLSLNHLGMVYLFVDLTLSMSPLSMPYKVVCGDSPLKTLTCPPWSPVCWRLRGWDRFMYVASTCIGDFPS